RRRGAYARLCLTSGGAGIGGLLFFIHLSVSVAVVRGGDGDAPPSSPLDACAHRIADSGPLADVARVPDRPFDASGRRAEASASTMSGWTSAPLVTGPVASVRLGWLGPRGRDVLSDAGRCEDENSFGGEEPAPSPRFLPRPGARGCGRRRSARQHARRRRHSTSANERDASSDGSNPAGMVRFFAERVVGAAHRRHDELARGSERPARLLCDGALHRGSWHPWVTTRDVQPFARTI